MQILVVADIESKYIWDYFDKERFKDIELVISCGDLKASYLSFLVTMIPVPVLYVHGNHDYRYSTNPPEGCDSIEDKIITYKGVRIAGLGGSMEYRGGMHQYTEEQMQKRVNKLLKNAKNSIDILVTHASAYQLGDGEGMCHMGFKCFYDVYEKALPLYHLHGHNHLNYSHNVKRILQYKDITIINGYDYYILDFKR